MLVIAGLGAGTFALHKGKTVPNKPIAKAVLSDEDEREEESESEDSNSNKEDSDADGGEDQDIKEFKDKDKKDEVKKVNTTTTQRAEIDDDELEDEDGKEEDDTNFKLIFEPSASGTVYTPVSRIIKAKIKQEVEKKDGLGVGINKIKLEVKTAQGVIKYEGTALKTEKLFGLFGVEVPVDLEIDPITGKIVSVNQTFWVKILDFFSL